MRRIGIDVKDNDYLDFLSVCVEDNLSIEEKLKSIMGCHVIVYRNRRKMDNQKLFYS